LKDFDKLNEEIKKKNYENLELMDIFLKEKIKINEELKFYNTLSVINNMEFKKEDNFIRKIKKAKNRVLLNFLNKLSTSSSKTGAPSNSCTLHLSTNKPKSKAINQNHNNIFVNNLPLISSSRIEKRV